MGLSGPARQVVIDSEKKYGEYFRSEYHDLGKAEELAVELRRAVLDLQCRAAQRQMLLRKASEQLDVVNAAVRDSHTPLFEAQMKIMSLNHHHNPHLNYLGYIETRESVYGLASESSRHLEKDRTGWKQVAALASKQSVRAEEELPLVVECPVDRTKLRVPKGKRQILVTCASCKYKFVVNSSDAEGDTAKILHPDPIRRGAMRQIRALFARSDKASI
jgi:hypothetical protein